MHTSEPAVPTRRRRVLVTGAGGTAAFGFLYLAERADIDFYAADIDPVASGLYLVPAVRRVLLPRGDAPEFVATVVDVCRRLEIDVLVPTVDIELLPLAAVRGALARSGTVLLAAPEATLVACLDKAELARVCAADCELPDTAVLTEGTPVSLPSIVKPRAGNGSRGVRLLTEPQDLVGVPRDGSHIVQEYLPGEELSVDIFVRSDGVVVSAVPRTRDKVDSGVAVAGRTVADAECVQVATTAARAVGLRGIGNVRLRRRADGRPALLEVNPRLPGVAGADRRRRRQPRRAGPGRSPRRGRPRPRAVPRGGDGALPRRDRRRDRRLRSRRAGFGRSCAGMSAALDLGTDWHTHTTATDGAATPREMVDAAAAAGLHRLHLTDHVRAGSTWLPEYVAEVTRLRSGTPVEVVCGVEATILDVKGAVDLPPDLRGVEQVAVSDHPFPTRSGPVNPEEMRRRIESG